MSVPPEDDDHGDRGDHDDVGYGRPPKRSRFPKGKSGNQNRRHPKRSEGRFEMMTRILLKPVDITVSGESKKVTTLEAILFQLRAKELSDHPRASSIRLKYEEFARQNSQPQQQIVFLDSDYTRAMAARSPDKDDDHDL
jgi:hypothetical protein